MKCATFKSIKQILGFWRVRWHQRWFWLMVPSGSARLGSLGRGVWVREVVKAALKGNLGGKQTSFAFVKPIMFLKRHSFWPSVRLNHLTPDTRERVEKKVFFSLFAVFAAWTEFKALCSHVPQEQALSVESVIIGASVGNIFPFFREDLKKL